MELLYNPDAMSDEELRKTFVAREKLIDELISLIKSQPDAAGIQHAVIIAPRGMGKTTVLLMLRLAITDRGLSDKWQPVKFPEESYNITELSEFWIQILTLVAGDTKDPELLHRVDQITVQFKDNDELQQAAVALIKDWRNKHNKRLLVLAENLDMIFEQINDERENARLRDVLMNDGTIMLIGGATTFFDEARAYDQPLYNFFRKYDLYDLELEQIQELLRRRAEIDQIANFEETLRVNASRLRVMEYFTGGNPRLVLMLYHVLTNSDISEVKRGMEMLLDEVTPYYKAKVESLSPQQRKILDYIARESAKTHEGSTPTAIASGTRLKVNLVTAQIKRLSDSGYIRSANLRGRNSYYALSEPLFVIWHQMRLGRNGRTRMQWLVNFLKLWYTANEIRSESKRLAEVLRSHIAADHVGEARDVLEHLQYLVDAIDDLTVRTEVMDDLIHGYLELNDISSVSELLANFDPNSLPSNTLASLQTAGCLSTQTIDPARESTLPLDQQKNEEVKAILSLAAEAILDKRVDDALAHLDRVLSLRPNLPKVWEVRGSILNKLKRPHDALVSYDTALSIDANYIKALNKSGRVLMTLKRFEEALSRFDRSLALNDQDDTVWNDHGLSLAGQSLHEKALASFDKALGLNSKNEEAWCNRGQSLLQLLKLDDDGNSTDPTLLFTELEDLIQTFNHVVESVPNNDLMRLTHFKAHSLKLLIHCSLGKTLEAQNDWNGAMHLIAQISSDQFSFEDKNELLSQVLIGAAELGQIEHVRKLIAESNLEESLFPLVRAIDYLLTGNQDLVEKLSPEIRSIVEEIVAKLSMNAVGVKESAPKSRPQKKKSSSRRTKRQL